MDKVYCLACGGVVGSNVPLSEGETRCSCSPSASDDSAFHRSVPPPATATSIICPSCGAHVSQGATRCDDCGALIATKRCPWCLAWNLDDAQSCRSCGRDMPHGQQIDLTCPHCDCLLHDEHVLDLHFSACDACGGMFLTPSMIQRVIQAGPDAAKLRLGLPARSNDAPAPSVSYIKCPVCGEVMNRQMFGRFSGVVVDVCSKHGIWFDESELATALRFIQEGGIDKLRSRHLEQQRREHVAQTSRQSSDGLKRTMTQAGASEFSTPWGPARTHIGTEFVLTIINLWKTR